MFAGRSWAYSSTTFSTIPKIWPLYLFNLYFSCNPPYSPPQYVFKNVKPPHQLLYRPSNNERSLSNRKSLSVVCSWHTCSNSDICLFMTWMQQFRHLSVHDDMNAAIQTFVCSWWHECSNSDICLFMTTWMQQFRHLSVHDDMNAAIQTFVCSWHECSNSDSV